MQISDFNKVENRLDSVKSKRIEQANAHFEAGIAFLHEAIEDGFENKALRMFA